MFKLEKKKKAQEVYDGEFHLGGHNQKGKTLTCTRNQQVEDPRGRSMHKNERLILTSLTFTDDYRRAENLSILPLLILPRLMQKKKNPKMFSALIKKVLERK